MHQATVAAFLNQKGGVGKTTSVVNIGCGLAILGQKVLIVDLDPQGHLSAFLGINTDSLETTIYDVLRARVAPKDAIITQQLGARLTIDGQDSTLSIGIIPSNLDLAEAESGLALTPDREILLRKAIGTLGADFDYILIDCPPSLGLLSTNALVASKKVFVPVQTEYLAFESLENLLKTIETVMARRNPELQIGGLIATRYDRRKVINRT
ncbi:MAG: ParA family protein, partial [Candidatus Krumholzibacteriota bacterium]|nr:ParA family protein [Candidatus Krumholzibacteriota bacterium]